MGTFTYSPLTDGTLADVADINTPMAAISTVLNGGIDSTNITPASIAPASLSAAANPETRQRRNNANYVVSGGTIATSATLGSTITAMVAYNNGKEQIVGAFPKTFTASKDTYVDEKDDGTYVFVEVANAATTGMTLTTNSDGSNALRIAKVVTSATAITSVVQTGTDSIGNIIYNITPISGAGSWLPWTPTWTNLTVGNGVVTAKYQQIGKTVFFKLHIIGGTTSSITGSTVVTLPITSAALIGAASPVIGQTRIMGFHGPCILNNTTTMIIRWYQASGSGQIEANTGAASPATFTTSQEIYAIGTYEAA